MGKVNNEKLILGGEGMPRVKLFSEKENKEELVRTIKSKLTYYGRYQQDLAKIMGVSEKTVTNRLQKPEYFTLQELIKICGYMKIEIAITEKGVECR